MVKEGCALIEIRRRSLCSCPIVLSARVTQSTLRDLSRKDTSLSFVAFERVNEVDLGSSKTEVSYPYGRRYLMDIPGKPQQMWRYLRVREHLSINPIVSEMSSSQDHDKESFRKWIPSSGANNPCTTGHIPPSDQGPETRITRGS